MVVKVRTLTASDTLAGKSLGLCDLPKFTEAVEAAPEGSIVVLDWSDVEVASASYFGATVIPILRRTISGDLDRYLVVSGLNQTGHDELKLVLEYLGLVMLVCDLSKESTIKNLRVLGKLDSSYAETLAALHEFHGASASTLYAHQRRSRTRIGKTGWINRLSNLHRLRLVKKVKLGREYVFEPID